MAEEFLPCWKCKKMMGKGNGNEEDGYWFFAQSSLSIVEENNSLYIKCAHCGVLHKTIGNSKGGLKIIGLK